MDLKSVQISMLSPEPLTQLIALIISWAISTVLSYVFGKKKQKMVYDMAVFLLKAVRDKSQKDIVKKILNEVIWYLENGIFDAESLKEDVEKHVS